MDQSDHNFASALCLVDRENKVTWTDHRAERMSLFAGGGLNCTCFYGHWSHLSGMTAFLQLPVESCLGGQHGHTGSNQAAFGRALRQPLPDLCITVLGMSQLFHAIGMRVETSLFQMNHLENRLMIAAFAISSGLQLLVTEVLYC